MNRRNAAAIQDCTARTLARKSSGMDRRKQRDGRGEHRQNQNPQQHRAFVIAPDAGDFIDQRFRGMRVLDDIDEREIGLDMRDGQGQISVSHEAKSHQRGRRRDRHQALVAVDAAPYRQHGIDERQRQSEDERVMAGFDDHARLFRQNLAWRPHRRVLICPCLPLPRPPARRPASSGRRRPRAAYSAHRAWREYCRRERLCPAPRHLRRRRLALRGRDPAKAPV